MRQYPKFSHAEIKYIRELVMKSDSELLPEAEFKGMRSFTPFKNDLANKLAKYENVLYEHGIKPI